MNTTESRLVDDDRKTRGELVAELAAARRRIFSLERLGGRLRKEYRERIRERKLFSNGPVTLFKWRNTPGWPVEYVSKNVDDLMGYGRRSFLSGEVAYAAVIHPDDLERVGAEVVANDRSNAETFLHHPYRVTCADGAVIWISDYTLILRDDAGRITHYVGYLMDITSRIVIEESLRESERRWKFALEGNRDGVWDWNAETDEVYFSPRWKEMLGYEDHEISHRLEEWKSRLHPEDREATYRSLSRHLSGEAPYYESEHRIRCKDGSYKWILDRGKVVERRPDGEPLRVMGTHTDISDRKEAEAALAKSWESLALAQRMARIGSWEWRMETGEVTWSDEVYRIFGVERASFDLTYEKYLNLLHPDDRDFLVARVRKALETGGDYEVEHRIIRPDSDIRFIHAIGRVTRGEDGQPLGLMGTVQDITEKVVADREIQRRESMLRAMSEASHDALVMIDSHDRVLFWNPAAERMFGYSREEALRTPLHEMITVDEERAAAYRGLEGFARTGTGPVLDRVMEFPARRKNGDHFPVERAVASFHLDGAWYAVGVVRDISERKVAEARLREMATTDELTGMFNRRHFRELAERQLTVARRYLKPFSLVMFDVDRFKRVNDTYGHDIGDRVLRTLADAAHRFIRKSDFVGRLGGEEFAFCLPETDLPQAQGAAERFRLEIASLAIPVDGETVRFTVSLGVACLNTPDETLDALFKRADTALYRAKEEGRNQVCVG